jgi:hypothetical protein
VTHDFENLVLVVDGQVVDPNPPAPINHAPVAADDFPVLGGPDADFGPDHQDHDVFTYTVADGHGGFATAHLDILVLGDGCNIIPDPGSV